QRQQDRVGAYAVQFLQAQREDVEQLPEHSRLLFPQNERRHADEEDSEDRERQVVEPELGKAEPLGEGADADLLEVERRKAVADDAPGARKRRDRNEQAGEA